MRALVVSAVLAACGGSSSDVTKLADEPATVTGFAADERGVAWLAAGKDTTQLKTLTAGTSLTIANGLLLHPALDRDMVYWSDGEHIWRSPRTTAKPVQIGEIDDVTRSLVVAGGFVYWATPGKIGRIPLAGGPSQIVADRPPVENFVFDRIAVDGTRIVAALGHDRAIELWQLDGAPHRLAHVQGYTEGLLIDGATILLARTTPTGGEVLAFDVTGAQRGAPVAGSLLDARGGTVYVSTSKPQSATFAIGRDGVARRIGPRGLLGVVVGDRLYGQFQDAELRTSIGSVRSSP